MRTLYAFKNIIANVASVIILTILGFFTRKVFIDSLGVEYLGLNGLLQEVIGMLSLVEGGIGTSIVYNLYKPLAENNKPQIIALVQLYRKIYKFIALAVFVLSLLLYPFLDVFIKNGENLSYVSLVYFIFVINNIMGYLMADKWSLIISDQKQYILTKYSIVFQIVVSIVKIFILLYFKNYIAYLIVELFMTLCYNGLIVKLVRRMYPYIVTKKKYKVESEVTKNIVKNVKALFLHSIGGYLLHSTDNIIISSFIGVGMVGLASNYTLIISQAKSLTKPIVTSMKSSIGNLVAQDSIERQYEIYKVVELLNFFLVGTVIIVIYNVITPFITWWLGEDYILSDAIVLVLCINYFVDEIRSPIMMYKYVSGIFTADKYVVFVTAIINLLVSIILVRYLGYMGVLLGTSIAILCTASWNWPRLVYKYTFKKKVFGYYKNYIFSVLILAIVLFITKSVNNYLFDSQSSFFYIILRSVLSFLIFLIIFFVINIKKPEFLYLINSVRFVISKR